MKGEIDKDRMRGVGKKRVGTKGGMDGGMDGRMIETHSKQLIPDGIKLLFH